tara:strand:- start:6706 stop:6930 length:225 start_codon:yes stop_codon:yes gene_type:complete
VSVLGGAEAVKFFCQNTIRCSARTGDFCKNPEGLNFTAMALAKGNRLSLLSFFLFYGTISSLLPYPLIEDLQLQ